MSDNLFGSFMDALKKDLDKIQSSKENVPVKEFSTLEKNEEKEITALLIVLMSGKVHPNDFEPRVKDLFKKKFGDNWIVEIGFGPEPEGEADGNLQSRDPNCSEQKD